MPADREILAITISRRSTGVSFGFALGYTDDRRHVVLEDSADGKLLKGDQIFQLGRSGAALLSHQALLKLIELKTQLVLKVWRFDASTGRREFLLLTHTEDVGSNAASSHFRSEQPRLREVPSPFNSTKTTLPDYTARGTGAALSRRQQSSGPRGSLPRSRTSSGSVTTAAGIGPPQTETSPPQTETSPPQTETSPPQTETSPPQTETSPPQTETSPSATSPSAPSPLAANTTTGTAARTTSAMTAATSAGMAVYPVRRASLVPAEPRHFAAGTTTGSLYAVTIVKQGGDTGLTITGSVDSVMGAIFTRKVASGSPAEAAGVGAGDRILEVNGVSVLTMGSGDCKALFCQEGDELKLLLQEIDAEQFARLTAVAAAMIADPGYTKPAGFFRPIGLPISAGLSGDGKLRIASVPAGGGAAHGIRLTDVSVPPPPGHVGSSVAVFVTDAGKDARLAVGDRLLAVNNRGLLALGAGAADVTTDALALATEPTPVVYQRLGSGAAELLQSVRATSTVRVASPTVAVTAPYAGPTPEEAAAAVRKEAELTSALAKAAAAEAGRKVAEAACKSAEAALHDARTRAEDAERAGVQADADELKAVKADLQTAEAAKVAAEARAEASEAAKAAEAIAADEARAALHAAQAEAEAAKAEVIDALSEMEDLASKERGTSDALAKATAASAASEQELNKLQAHVEMMKAAAEAGPAKDADADADADGGAWGAKLAMKGVELQAARNEAAEAAAACKAAQAEAEASKAALLGFRAKAAADAAGSRAALEAAELEAEDALSQAAAQVQLAEESAAAASAVVDADVAAGPARSESFDDDDDADGSDVGDSAFLQAELAAKEKELELAQFSLAEAQTVAEELRATLVSSRAVQRGISEIVRSFSAPPVVELAAAAAAAAAAAVDTTLTAAAAEKMQAEIGEAKAEAAAAQSAAEDAKAALQEVQAEADAHAAALEEAAEKEKAAADELRKTAASESPALQDASPNERVAAALRGHPSGCYVVWTTAATTEGSGAGLMLSVSDSKESVHCIQIKSKSNASGNTIYWLDTTGSTGCHSLGKLVQHHRTTPFTNAGLLLAWAVSMGGRSSTSSSSSPSSVRHVSVNRLPGRQFGFVLVGSVDADPDKDDLNGDPDANGCAGGAYVRLVGRRDAAAAGLVTGDRVVALNGLSVAGMSHREVYQRLQERDEGQVELAVQLDGDGASIVARAVEAAAVASGTAREINIPGCRANPDGLGISILTNELGDVLVCEIAVGGAAALSGEVSIGDQILMCHGIDFRGFTHDDALDTLSLPRDDVHMVVTANPAAWEAAVQKEWMEWPSLDGSSKAAASAPGSSSELGGESAAAETEGGGAEGGGGATAAAAEVGTGDAGDGEGIVAVHPQATTLPAAADDQSEDGGNVSYFGADDLDAAPDAPVVLRRRLSMSNSPMRKISLARNNLSESLNFSLVSIDHGNGETELHVAGVQPGSVADCAGLRDGDMIVGVGDDVAPVTAEGFRTMMSTQLDIDIHSVRNEDEGQEVEEKEAKKEETGNLDESLSDDAEDAGVEQGNGSAGAGAVVTADEGGQPTNTSTSGRSLARNDSFIADVSELYSELDQDAADAAEEETDAIVRLASTAMVAASPEWHSQSGIGHDPVTTVGQRLRIDVGSSIYGEDVSNLPFGIEGGVDTPYGAAFVTDVEAAVRMFSNSGKCVAVGDRIMSINNVSVISCTESEVRDQLAASMEDMTAPTVLFVLRPSAISFAGVQEDYQAAVASGGAARAAHGHWVRPLALALGDLPTIAHPRTEGQRDLTSDMGLPYTDGDILTCTVDRIDGSLGLSVVPMLGSTFVIKTLSEASQVLEYGDRILSVNATCMSIGTPKDCTLALKRAGDSVDIVVHRVGLQNFNRLYLQPPPYTPQRSASYDGPSPSPLRTPGGGGRSRPPSVDFGDEYASPGAIAALAAVAESIHQHQSVTEDEDEDGGDEGASPLAIVETVANYQPSPTPLAEIYGEDVHAGARHDGMVPLDHCTISFARDNANQTWGFGVKPSRYGTHVVSSNIKPNAPAFGHLQKGDLLFAINGTAVSNVTSEEIVAICSEPQLTLQVDIGRPLSGAEEDGRSDAQVEVDNALEVEVNAPPSSPPYSGGRRGDAEADDTGFDLDGGEEDEEAAAAAAAVEVDSALSTGDEGEDTAEGEDSVAVAQPQISARPAATFGPRRTQSKKQEHAAKQGDVGDTLGLGRVHHVTAIFSDGGTAPFHLGRNDNGDRLATVVHVDVDMDSEDDDEDGGGSAEEGGGGARIRLRVGDNLLALNHSSVVGVDGDEALDNADASGRVVVSVLRAAELSKQPRIVKANAYRKQDGSWPFQVVGGRKLGCVDGIFVESAEPAVGLSQHDRLVQYNGRNMLNVPLEDVEHILDENVELQMVALRFGGGGGGGGGGGRVAEGWANGVDSGGRFDFSSDEDESEDGGGGGIGTALGSTLADATVAHHPAQAPINVAAASVAAAAGGPQQSSSSSKNPKKVKSGFKSFFGGGKKKKQKQKQKEEAIAMDTLAGGESGALNSAAGPVRQTGWN
eukprot:gene3151-9937_t